MVDKMYDLFDRAPWILYGSILIADLAILVAIGYGLGRAAAWLFG